MAAHTPATGLHTRTAIRKELTATVADLLNEAFNGDHEARGWLLQAFPAHSYFLTEAWQQQQVATPNNQRDL
jgi:hypothetical protein